MKILIEKFTAEDSTYYSIISFGTDSANEEVRRIQSISRVVFDQISYQDNDPENAIRIRLYEERSSGLPVVNDDDE